MTDKASSTSASSSTNSPDNSSTKSVAITMAQVNPVVGDIVNNAGRVDKIVTGNPRADLIVFPELNITGYPPEDLILKPAFVTKAMTEVETLAGRLPAGHPAVICGSPWRIDGEIYNAAVVIMDQAIKKIICKTHLPNYGVFDEKRLFASANDDQNGVVEIAGIKIGVLICEDMWYPEVAEKLADQGGQLLVIPNGSPFTTNKINDRQSHGADRVGETGLPLIYVNQVGGQDELVFDGASFAMNADGSIAARSIPFEEDEQTLHVEQIDGGWQIKSADIIPDPYGRLQAMYQALMLGIRDYVEKNNFPGVIIGLSGGVDSALTAVLAVDALGASRVDCVMMPSPYTSDESLADAEELIKNIATKYDVIDIGPGMDAFDTMLADPFANTTKGVAEENIQSRIRGALLMALSNKLGGMVLATGNKSEMSVGYATLYGDMSGGFAALKDVYKTDVFALCRWRNNHKPDYAHGPDGHIIPDRIITKPPSAELKPDQEDSDSLPPYEALDDILKLLIEEEASLQQVVSAGHNITVVKQVWQLLDRAEYKRRQSAPGVKITAKAFGKERRYPITSRAGHALGVL